MRFLCCARLIFDGGAAHSGGVAGTYSGAMMLFENAGGYILAAIIAFMAGVLITALLIKNRNKKEDFQNGNSTDITHGKE